MKVYITKYALSKGIQEYEVPVIDPNSYHVSINHAMYQQHFFEPDWHTDKKSAIQQAESMRVKKLDWLHSKIFKLRGLKFNGNS